MFEVIYFVLVFVLIGIKDSLASSQIRNYSPGVRYHAPKQNASFNYSYVNLKYMPGYKLNSAVLTKITQTNKTDCVKQCLLTDGLCISINIQNLTDGNGNEIDCYLLKNDLYRLLSSALWKMDGWTHYIISVKKN